MFYTYKNMLNTSEQFLANCIVYRISIAEIGIFDVVMWSVCSSHTDKDILHKLEAQFVCCNISKNEEFLQCRFIKYTCSYILSIFLKQLQVPPGGHFFIFIKYKCY